MTNVLQRMDETIHRFFIFNSSYGKKEGEESKKVFYFHPSDTDENTKIKDVGLSEAIIAFTGTFTDESDCEALHTQKTTQLFYQPEAEFWMVLVVNVPKEIRLKERIEVTEYRGGDVHDRIYHAMLEQCYKMFRLFNGTFQMNIDNNGVQALQQQLKHFYDKYLLSLKLPACDVMGMTHSIQYLPLEKSLFLRAHNFVSMLSATFPLILETILLYNEQIVCCGKINPLDLHCLHEYIVGEVLPKMFDSEADSAVLMRTNSTVSESYRNGAFLTGPESKDNNSESLPKIFISNGSELSVYHLILYRALNTTLCLFVDEHEQPNRDFYTELHSYMGPQLISLGRDIGCTLSQKQMQSNGKLSASVTVPPVASASTVATSPMTISPGAPNAGLATPKFLFINEQSLRHLSNICIERERGRNKESQSLPMNVFNLIADLGTDEKMVSDCSAAFEEIQVKTTNDFWIVKRRCNWRQYYVIIFNCKATLLDITLEAKRIFERELTDDVFFDK